MGRWSPARARLDRPPHFIITDSTGAAHALMMLAGEGAYEGWSYVATGTDPEADANHDLTGVLYQGPLPPVGLLP